MSVVRNGLDGCGSCLQQRTRQIELFVKFYHGVAKATFSSPALLLQSLAYFFSQSKVELRLDELRSCPSCTVFDPPDFHVLFVVHGGRT